MSATSDEKLAFATRLHEVCGDKDLPERGRMTTLGRLFGTTPNAARKWLHGEGLPELEMAIRIAKWGDVNLEWLLTGRPPKRGSTIEMRNVVVGEALQDLPAEDRKAALDYIRYKIESARPVLTAEKAARYVKALETLAGEKPKR